MVSLKDMETITVQALKDTLVHFGTDEVLVDVREPYEFAGGNIPGARNIPLGDIPNAADELKKFKTVYVNCRSGGRSAHACEFLVGVGVHAVNVEGGMIAWGKS